MADCTRYRCATSARVHHYRDEDGREVEVRMNPPELGANTVDEICTDEIHLEQMDSNHYWMRINNVVFDFYARGKITLTYEADGAKEFTVSREESCEAHEHWRGDPEDGS